MEKNGGITWKSPDYVIEKSSFIKPDGWIYTILDRINQEKVLKYCARWHIGLPKEVQEYEEQFNKGGYA
jgi:hypothetical protein